MFSAYSRHRRPISKWLILSLSQGHPFSRAYLRQCKWPAPAALLHVRSSHMHMSRECTSGTPGVRYGPQPMASIRPRDSQSRGPASDNQGDHDARPSRICLRTCSSQRRSAACGTRTACHRPGQNRRHPCSASRSQTVTRNSAAYQRAEASSNPCGTRAAGSCYTPGTPTGHGVRSSSVVTS